MPEEQPSRFELGFERRAPTLSPMQRRLSATMRVVCFKAALLLVLQAEGDERKLVNKAKGEQVLGRSVSNRREA